MSFRQRLTGGQPVRSTGGPFSYGVSVLKRWALILLFGLATTVAGCGTLVERGESSKTYRSSGHYYVGVQYDWRLLTLEGSGSYDYIPMFCYLSIVCPFVTLLSMPVDLAVDTVMLYSDHQSKLIEQQRFNRSLRDEYCFAEDGPDEAELKRWGLDASFCLHVSNG